MSSKYFEWIARSEKPAPPPPPKSKKERVKNWLYYNVWWIITIVIVLSIALSMLFNALGIGKFKPDYVFAYIGSSAPDEKVVQEIEEQLALLGKDVNGDGTVKVTLNVYETLSSGDAEIELYYNTASDTRLLADLTKGDSYFFLMDNAPAVQRTWQFLANADGTPPDDDDYSAEGKYVAVKDCRALAISTQWSKWNSLSFGRRCFYGEMASGHEAEEKLWLLLTEGTEK